MKPKHHSRLAKLVCGIAVVLGITALSCTKKSSTLSLSAKSHARNVRVTTPHLKELSNKVTFVGFVEPQRFVNLHFVLPGRIESCRIREGAILKKGDEICRLDRSAVDLEVARARNAMNATLKVMESNLAEKQKALFDAGVIGQAEFEQVRIQAETAKASHQDSKTLYEMAIKKQVEHVLRAPWDGKITKLLVKPGQPISPEIPVAFLSNEDGFQIKTDLHAVHFNKLKVGASAKINSVSSKKVPAQIPLIVTEKSPAVTPSTQSFQTSLVLKNRGDASLLTLGILVSGEIELEHISRARVIPQASLNSWSQDGKATVYVVDANSQLKLVEVEIGTLSDGMAQVLSGLDDNSRVVTEIAPDFITGMPVKELAE